MSAATVFSLEAIRTDGWFERVGERVGSFDALCSILGERFFAFSLITGARITSLTVDRRDPSASVVEFEVSGAASELGAVTQRLNLERFRRRLVSALLAEETSYPAPVRETDVEGIQMHIGVRYLLLAPLYGYSLLELECGEAGSFLRVSHDGELERYELGEFRSLLRRWIIEELDRAGSRSGPERSGLDLSILPEAKAAAERGEHATVVRLLGGWLMPLSFYLRTPEGRALGPELRGDLGQALGMLGTALIAESDVEAGHQSLRLAVQYAVDSPRAADAYARLGEAFMRARRFGEAIAPLRRAAELGAEPDRVWPALGQAFFAEERLLAAWGATLEARRHGLDDAVEGISKQLRNRLPLLEQWQRAVAPVALEPSSSPEAVAAPGQ